MKRYSNPVVEVHKYIDKNVKLPIKKLRSFLFNMSFFFILVILLGFIIKFSFNLVNKNIFVKKEVLEYAKVILKEVNYEYSNIEIDSVNNCSSCGSFGCSRVKGCYHYLVNIYLDDNNMNQITIDYYDDEGIQDYDTELLKQYTLVYERKKTQILRAFQEARVIQKFGVTRVDAYVSSNLKDTLNIEFINKLDLMKVERLDPYKIELHFQDGYKITFSNDKYYTVYDSSEKKITCEFNDSVKALEELREWIR